MKIPEGHAPTLHWIKNNPSPYVSDIADMQHYVDKLLAAKKSSLRWNVTFVILLACFNAILNRQTPSHLIPLSFVLPIIAGFLFYRHDMKAFYKNDEAGPGCKVAAKYLKDWQPLSGLPNEGAMHDYLYQVASQVIVYEKKLGHAHPLTKKTRDHFHDAHSSIHLFGICGRSWKPYFNPSEEKKRELKGTLMDL